MSLAVTSSYRKREPDVASRTSSREKPRDTILKSNLRRAGAISFLAVGFDKHDGARTSRFKAG